jgi:ribosome recycling factor
MQEEYKLLKEKMQKALDSLAKDFSLIRASRVNPSVLDKITVPYFGNDTKLIQLASISVDQATTLVIKPWDKSTISLIEKAILTSDIGVNPHNDGDVIKINFPPLTQEKRTELCKEVYKLGENIKISLRSIRRDVLDQYKLMKKNSQITEDDLKLFKKDIDIILTDYYLHVDKMVKTKESEILKISLIEIYLS